MRILITYPPMVRRIDEFRHYFVDKNIEVYCPPIVQTLTVDELLTLVPQFDGWIIGDDPATREVFVAGKQGALRAAVKWGVGVDNVDFGAAEDLGIPVLNTPGMFGAEVADVAVSYVTALARETFLIDREVRAGRWPKPCGISLTHKTLALVGFGDIGRSAAKRLLAADMQVIVYDPFFKAVDGLAVEPAPWPERLDEADFIVLTCALTAQNFHMIDAEVLARTRPGVRIVNVARGPLIDQQALVAALESGQVHSAALDVFEEEPLPLTSPLHRHKRCIFGSHNASNTAEAVQRASEKAIQLLFGLLKIA